jgi:hypothetical protein
MGLSRTGVLVRLPQYVDPKWDCPGLVFWYGYHSMWTIMGLSRTGVLVRSPQYVDPKWDCPGLVFCYGYHSMWTLNNLCLLSIPKTMNWPVENVLSN